MNKDIVLIGMPGSGKSSVAKALSARLGLTLADVDKIIEEEMNMNIPQIFERYGESAFRMKEAETMMKLSGTGCVMSLGGGAVENNSCMRALRKNGEIIYLKANINTLERRVRNSRSRPLLTKGDLYENLVRLFERREHLYCSYADFEVSVDRLSVERIVDCILEYVIE